MSLKMRDPVVHTGSMYVVITLHLEGNGWPWKILFKTLTELRYTLWAVWTLGQTSLNARNQVKGSCIERLSCPILNS